jgi:glycosyltransferase involved in cell wall biosynthesis
MQIRRNAQVFIGHSESNLESFDSGWREDQKKFRVIYNGFEFPEPVPDRTWARRDLALDDDELVLLHVGSLRPEKDHSSLLAIARQVFDHRGGGLLMLVGEGKLKSQVEQRAAALGLSDSIRLEGGRRDVWPYYAAADAMVFPSVTEGFANALVEAQAAGLPVVASDIPAHRESVAPDQQEFLFEIGNPNAAAELVLRQLESAAAGCNRWVESSRHHVRSRFSADRSAGLLADLYAEVFNR